MISQEVYIAKAVGYLEGEGHFRVDGNSPSIEAKSINPSSLFFLQRVLGGTITPLKDSRPNARQCWRWRVSGDAAIYVAKKLIDSDLLDIKSAECRAVALCKDYPQGTSVGEYLRHRAQSLRGAEYALPTG